jgi:hypothetical protein
MDFWTTLYLSLDLIMRKSVRGNQSNDARVCHSEGVCPNDEYL